MFLKIVKFVGKFVKIQAKQSLSSNTFSMSDLAEQNEETSLPICDKQTYSTISIRLYFCFQTSWLN